MPVTLANRRECAWILNSEPASERAENGVRADAWVGRAAGGGEGSLSSRWGRPALGRRPQQTALRGFHGRCTQRRDQSSFRAIGAAPEGRRSSRRSDQRPGRVGRGHRLRLSGDAAPPGAAAALLDRLDSFVGFPPLQRARSSSLFRCFQVPKVGEGRWVWRSEATAKAERQNDRDVGGGGERLETFIWQAEMWTQIEAQKKIKKRRGWREPCGRGPSGPGEANSRALGWWGGGMGKGEGKGAIPGRGTEKSGIAWRRIVVAFLWRFLQKSVSYWSSCTSRSKPASRRRSTRAKPMPEAGVSTPPFWTRSSASILALSSARASPDSTSMRAVAQ